MKTLIKNPRLLKGAIFLVGGLVVALIWGGSVMLAHMAVPIPYKAGAAVPAWVPGTVRHWDGMIEQTAAKYNIDANLLRIIMTIESGGYTKADSGQAEGLMQITPPTGGDIAKKYLKTARESYDLFDPATSIEFGAAYLVHLRGVFCDAADDPTGNTCIELIAAGYNGGPGAANKLFKGEGITDIQTLSYSRDACNMWRERGSKSSPTYDRWLERGGQDLIDKAANEQK